MIPIAAVKIVIKEKHSAPFAGGENLPSNVIEFIGLITMAFGGERAKGATEIAIAGGFHVSDSAEPIGEVITRQHCFGHVFWSETLPDYYTEFFNISQAAVIIYFSRQ